MDLGLANCSGAASSGAADLGGLHVAMIGAGSTTSAGTAASMRTTGGLIGVSTPAASGAANLGGRLSIAGSSAGYAVTITTDLSGVVHVVNLTGTASGASSATAASANRPAIAGTAAARSDTSANATVIPGLSGSSQGSSITSNNDLGNRPAIAGISGGGSSTGSAVLSIVYRLGGTSQGASATAAFLGIKWQASGVSAGITVTNPNATMRKYAQLRGHSGKTLDLGSGASGGSSVAWPPAALTIAGTPNVSLAGSS